MTASTCRRSDISTRYMAVNRVSDYYHVYVKRVRYSADLRESLQAMKYTPHQDWPIQMLVGSDEAIYHDGVGIIGGTRFRRRVCGGESPSARSD